MNKRGQFFLVAALVIIGILFGLATTYSNTQTSARETVVYDLSNEMNFEAGQVIDHGVFYSVNTEERNRRIENITDYYSRANPGTDFTVVYGDRNRLYIVAYNSGTAGSFGLTIGSNQIGSNIEQVSRFNDTIVPPVGDNEVTVVLGSARHTFTLRPGQTFFVLLKKENSGGSYVASSE